MTKIMKLGKNFTECFRSYDLDRLPNVMLGRSGRVSTNRVLLKDVRLHSYINNETMSALDNYAKYYKLNVYIKSLENDAYDDLGVSVFRKGKIGAVTTFPIKIKDGRDGVREFFKELYTKIDDAVNPVKSTVVPAKIKRTKSDEFKAYIYNVKDRYHDWKMNKIRNFIDKHTDECGAAKVISDVLEELHFSELHNV